MRPTAKPAVPRLQEKGRTGFSAPRPQQPPESMSPSRAGNRKTAGDMELQVLGQIPVAAFRVTLEAQA